MKILIVSSLETLSSSFWLLGKAFSSALHGADSMQDGLRFLFHCIQPFFGQGHDNENSDEYG